MCHLFEEIQQEENTEVNTMLFTFRVLMLAKIDTQKIVHNSRVLGDI